MGIACALHDGGNIGEVQVDIALFHDQVGNALHAGLENIVCQCERFPHGQRLVQTLQQLFVRDHDQRIHVLPQLCNAPFCLHHLLFPLKSKRLCDNGNGEDPGLLCQTCNDRCCASTGATAHTSGNKYHICTLQCSFDLVLIFLGALSADIRFISGATAFGELCTDLDLRGCLGIIQSLGICIYCNIFNILYAGRHHAIQCVSAAAADANHFDIYIRIKGILIDKISHLTFPPTKLL